MISYVHSIHMDCPTPTILRLSLPSNFDHGLLPLLLLLLLLLVQAPPPATAQSPNRPPPPERLPGLRFDKSMAIVLVILVVVFFILGFLSVYTRQCTELRLRGRLDLSIPFVRSDRRHRGLEPETIHTFPTFVYSTVKGLKIGRATLECVVCLNEFQDDETLRLIPKCSHVFHPQCIDVWLSTHSTCPVCRANLVPGPGDMSSSFVAIQIPDPGGAGSNQPHSGSNSDSEPQHSTQVGHHNRNGAEGPESPKVTSVHQNHPLRSRSTGYRISSLFPRSHSTGHSLVQPGENCERFTLRLPEEVRNQLLNSTLSRTRSCGVTFMRVSSGRTGYRTRSVGSARGRSYLQYERFGREARPDRRGFSWTPPFVNRADSTRCTKRSPESNMSPVAVDDAVGERSSDRLFPGGGSED